jgi:3-oxoacid CoA-transferase A subunit
MRPARAKLHRMVDLLSPADALAKVRPGDTVMVGGFGLVGAPLTLVAALLEAPGAHDLTVISNNLGEPGRGLGKLLPARRVKKAIGSYFTSNREVVEAHLAGEIEVELLPQGTLAEAIRAGGAGIGGFYVRTGAGTLLAQGREEREIDGQRYLFQLPLRADVALIRAAKADRAGNLVYPRTARNFNPDMATAATIVIAEVDEIVEVGALAPDEIATPHLYVDHLVLSEGVSA